MVYQRAWNTSFSSRSFRIFWSSSVVYAFGTGMEFVVIGWLIYEMTSSNLMVGVATGARMAPLFFLGIISGAVADWMQRRSFLILTAFVATIISVVMAFVLLTDTAGLLIVLLLVAVGGCVFACTLITSQAYTFDIVGSKKSLNGLSMNQLGMLGGGLIGAVISGLLIQLFGPGWQYLAVAVFYLSSAVILLQIKDIDRQSSPGRTPVLVNIGSYLNLLAGNRTLLILMCLVGITEILAFSHQTLLPVFAKEILAIGPFGLGILYAVRHGGGVVGLFCLANLRDCHYKGLLMFLVMGSLGLGLIILSKSTVTAAFIMSLILLNGCLMALDALYKTLMLTSVQEEQRGRAMGLWGLSVGVAPIGHVGIGALASILGASGALFLNGVLMTGIAVIAAVALTNVRRLP